MSRSVTAIPTLLVVALVAAACVDGDEPVDDTGPDLSQPLDFTAADGDSSAAAKVDFLVQGCTRWSTGQCIGNNPLTLVFSALVQQTPRAASWDFGDGSPAESGLVVKHTYATNGVYDVSLVVSAGTDTVSERKTSLVRVLASPPGGPCKTDDQCVRGTCVCAGSCAPPLADGFCLDDCSSLKVCPPLTDTVLALACVDLRSGATKAPQPWRGVTCLPLCTADNQCTRSGFSCRSAPGASGWRKVCLPPLPSDVGQPCRRADGTVDGAACIGGVCLDIGASGLCSSDCAKASCPDGTRCASFPGQGNRAICLDICGKGDCTSDPQLACETPDKQGSWGFEVTGRADPEGTRYCAPKRCTADTQCGLAGRCDSKKGGFCEPAK